MKTGPNALIAVATSVLALTVMSPIAHSAPSTPVGTTISTTALPPRQLLSGAASGYAISYSTTDEHGRRAIANGQVYLPSGRAPVGGWPVVSWAKGTVGVGDQCAMSTTLAAGRPDPYAVEISKPLLTRLLAAGTAVVSTDYIGLGSPDAHRYLETTAEAHAVIDIVRAAASRFPALSRTWVAVGHSQGGGAALAAGALTRSYGTGLGFRGTVAIAPASNIESVVSQLGPATPRIGLISNITATFAYILSGLKASRPDIDVDFYLTDLGRRTVAAAGDRCIAEERATLASVVPQQLLRRPLSDPTFTRALRAYLAVPTTGYRQPVVIEQGLADSVVSPALTTLLVGQLAAGGTIARYNVDRPATHYDVIGRTAGQSAAAIARMLT
ncbi:hypothetical protein ASG12_06695 [Williamsia sp. Leaf354]|uniref:alpha/beta fold hydrolase n=1 Tax=Williamsia sp. Leaf354 TaxID=1736349 RepID=UPI000701F6E1|nr:alpha/beta fold hydrolase [Williamsia sp. Leaf354]KQS00563.1 hypothetical protein ASG12_06695 [Williamsia sp. Leaf354]